MIYQYAKNIGFGAANNCNLLPFSREGESLFIVVNPDISFDPALLLPLLEWAADSSDVSCVAPLVHGQCGSIQFSVKRDPTITSLLLGKFSRLQSFSVLKRYDRWHRNLDRDYAHECIESSYLSGCFLVINSLRYAEIGGFCEKYFLHLEDADIVRRLSHYGRCIHNPIGAVVHRWARGSHHSSIQMVHLIYSLFVYMSIWGFKIY